MVAAIDSLSTSERIRNHFINSQFCSIYSVLLKKCFIDFAAWKSSHAHCPGLSIAANRRISKSECVAFKQSTAQTHTHARVAPTTVFRVVKLRHCAMSAKWYIQRENSQSIHSVFDILGQTVSCVFVHKEKYCAYDCLMTEVATILVIYIHFVSLIFRPDFPLKSNSIRFSRSNAIRCTQILVPLPLHKPRKS